MTEENKARKRKGAQQQSEKPSESGDGIKKPEKQKPFQGRYNPKHSDKYGALSHKSLAKFVMLIGAVVFVVYSSYNQQSIHTMAKVDEILDKKRHASFMCHPNYKKEIQDLNPVCLPARCGRFIADDLVTVSEAHKLLDLAKKGLAKGGGNGGASILDLHSGALSHGDNFINLYKTHPGVFSQKDFETYRSIKNKVKNAVAEHFNLDSEQLFLSHPTFFSELTSVPAVTLHDEYWHPHIDKETYPSFHFTSLLYLSDYKRDFTGGRFIFIDEHAKANRSVEPREGRVSAFTSGVENRHHVEPVTGGTRYALTMGFTCDKDKAIRDPGL